MTRMTKHLLIANLGTVCGLECSLTETMNLSMNDRDTVVITGFGPFKEFLVNPSWTAAQALKEAGLGEKFDVHIREVPVSYVKTQQIITELWQRLKPKFAVHLGIARGSRVLLLEQTGRNRGYKDRDVCGFCPQSCVEGGPEKLHSVIDMRVVSKHFKDTGIDVLPSADAGRFLCDFAYYCSLYHGHQRAAFIHMPSTGCLTSADRLVSLLQALILTMLRQLEDPGQAAPALPANILRRQT